ncbi:MAG: hypothetical protein RBS48_01815 [Ignavibacteriaceae bacterium]|jgi:ABC-type multidrug transport system ATPase subunit|nr:hypothetical protein [Ignavibacteriaceae bacterium]
MKLISIRFQYKNKDSREIILSEKINLDLTERGKTIIVSPDVNFLYEFGSILTGRSKQFEGEITDFKNEESLFIIPDFAAFPWMTVKENLLSVNSDIDDKLVSEFGLDAYLENKFDEMSFGFRVKLALIMALLAGKKIVVIFNPFKYIKSSYYDIFMDDLEKMRLKGVKVIVLSTEVKKELKFNSEYHLR